MKNKVTTVRVESHYHKNVKKEGFVLAVGRITGDEAVEEAAHWLGHS